MVPYSHTVYLTQVGMASALVLTVGYFGYCGLAYFAVMLACLVIGLRIQKARLLVRYVGSQFA